VTSKSIRRLELFQPKWLGSLWIDFHIARQLFRDRSRHWVWSFPIKDLNDLCQLKQLQVSLLWSVVYCTSSHLHIAHRSISDRDQESWLVKIVLDHLIIPFPSSWLLDFTRGQRTKTLPHLLSIRENVLIGCFYSLRVHHGPLISS